MRKHQGVNCNIRPKISYAALTSLSFTGPSNCEFCSCQIGTLPVGKAPLLDSFPISQTNYNPPILNLMGSISLPDQEAPYSITMKSASHSPFLFTAQNTSPVWPCVACNVYCVVSLCLIIDSSLLINCYQFNFSHAGCCVFAHFTLFRAEILPSATG